MSTPNGCTQIQVVKICKSVKSVICKSFTDFYKLLQSDDIFLDSDWLSVLQKVCNLCIGQGHVFCKVVKRKETVEPDFIIALRSF